MRLENDGHFVSASMLTKQSMNCVYIFCDVSYR